MCSLYSFSGLFGHITGIPNKYNDIQATVSGQITRPEDFEKELLDSLCTWQEHGYKAVWFTIPKEYAIYIPIALQHDFIYHHTTSKELVMICSLKEGARDLLPPYATQTLGVAGLVIDKDGNVLVEKELFKPELGYKLPGGGANFSEKIGDAAIREVKEETGIDTEFLGIIALRHGRNKDEEGISDIYVCCLLRPLTHDICIQEEEITESSWMPYAEFKKIARNSCAQFLAAYEANGAPIMCNSTGLLDLYVPQLFTDQKLL